MRVMRNCSWASLPALCFAVVIFLALSAVAQDRIDCTSMPSKILHRPIRYCVEIPASYDAPESKGRRYPILYMLHGLGDDEQTLYKTGGWTLIEDLRKQGKIVDFLIVVPEGDRTFYINSADGKVRYSDFFLQEFLPAIEKRYRVLPGREGRGINGISMGGYGALRFAFAHPELFSSVSAQSPALILETPKDLNAAAKSGSPDGQTLAPVYGNPIDAEHWDVNSPFVLARKHADSLRSTRIYFNCGNSDDYGFEKGAAALDAELTKLRIVHQYRPYPGGHTFQFFLAHLAETIEFHSQGWSRLK
jgi:S-formylglutathione hydrolase FrmB